MEVIQENGLQPVAFFCSFLQLFHNFKRDQASEMVGDIILSTHRRSNHDVGFPYFLDEKIWEKKRIGCIIDRDLAFHFHGNGQLRQRSTD